MYKDNKTEIYADSTSEVCFAPRILCFSIRSCTPCSWHDGDRAQSLTVRCVRCYQNIYCKHAWLWLHCRCSLMRWDFSLRQKVLCQKRSIILSCREMSGTSSCEKLLIGYGDHMQAKFNCWKFAFFILSVIWGAEFCIQSQSHVNYLTFELCLVVRVDGQCMTLYMLNWLWLTNMYIHLYVLV